MPSNSFLSEYSAAAAVVVVVAAAVVVVVVALGIVILQNTLLSNIFPIRKTKMILARGADSNLIVLINAVD